MIIVCPHCKKQANIPSGYVNRAKKLGVPRYCSKKCSGLARRHNRTIAESKAIKSAYDLKYKDRGYVLILRAWYFFDDYKKNPEKYRKIRQKKMPKHVEYCRQPKYKKYKEKYDKEYRAKKEYGEFWESHLALVKLEKELPSKKITKYNQGIINKTQKRKRKWQQENKSSMQRI